MLCFVSFARRARSRERIMYWVLARSVWRIERRRFRFGLCCAWLCDVLDMSVSADEAARSSIVSIWNAHAQVISSLDDSIGISHRERQFLYERERRL
jgi:hypothetical protein